MATKPKKNTLRDGSIGAAIVAALVVLLQLLGYMPGNAEPQTIPPRDPCLLYPSDAAADKQCVHLAGPPTIEPPQNSLKLS